MTGHDSTDVAMRTDPLLLGVCGWAGIAGAVAAIVSNLSGSLLVPDYSLVADTISDLAAGRYEIIQDLGLYGFAGSLMACALGAAHAHPGGARWSASVIALSIMASLVIVIGARNEYGDDDARATWAIHLGLTYALMLMFLLVSVLMAPGLGGFGAGYRTGTLVCAGLFVVTAAAYLASPDSYDGLVERAVALVAIGWTAMLSWMLLDLRGRGHGRRPGP